MSLEAGLSPTADQGSKPQKPPKPEIAQPVWRPVAGCTTLLVGTEVNTFQAQPLVPPALWYII